MSAILHMDERGLRAAAMRVASQYPDFYAFKATCEAAAEALERLGTLVAVGMVPASALDEAATEMASVVNGASGRLIAATREAERVAGAAGRPRCNLIR